MALTFLLRREAPHLNERLDISYRCKVSIYLRIRNSNRSSISSNLNPSLPIKSNVSRGGLPYQGKKCLHLRSFIHGGTPSVSLPLATPFQKVCVMHPEVGCGSNLNSNPHCFRCCRSGTDMSDIDQKSFLVTPITFGHI